jgi:uncharacterized membrane protein YgaE (UPF0421/DUF939 family)
MTLHSREKAECPCVIPMPQSLLTPALQLSIRSAVAAGLAVAVAEWLHFHYPLYAMIGAIIVSDLSPSQTRRLALVRVAGSALGATVGAATCCFLTPSPWSIGLSVLIAMFLGHLIRLQGAAKVTGYVCGIVCSATAPIRGPMASTV